MRVKMIQALCGEPSLSVGEEHEFEDAEAIRHIEAGHAIPVSPSAERAVKRTPEKRKK